MATGKIDNGIKTKRISKSVVAVADTQVIGGYYAYINIADEQIALFGQNWRDRVIITIPCGAVFSNGTNGVGGLISPYLQTGNNNAQFALAAPRPGTYICDFEVFYR